MTDPSRLWRAFPALLLAVILAGSPVAAALAADDPPRFFVDRIEVVGENPFSDAHTQSLLRPYLGEHVGFVGIQGGAQYLEQELRKRGHAFHKVLIPEQRLTGGTLRFEVVAFELDELQIDGNEHFEVENIRRSVPELSESGTPNTRALSRSLALANAHPVKQIGLTVKRSEKPQHINASLQVTDRSPHQVFANVNNRGSDGTGMERISLGYQYSNLFNLDQSLTVTYTTSPQQSDEVKQYGAAYRWPIYGIGGELSAFYTYSDVNNGPVADFFTVSGKGEFYGLRYAQHLLQIGRYRHQLVFSLEDKLFDSDARFQGELISPDLRSQPIGIEYRAEWVGNRTNLDFGVGLYRDLGGNSPDNAGIDQSFLDAVPNRRWTALRADGTVDHKFENNFLFRSRFSGQFTNEELISGEQFGLGGIDSLRGFQEREAAADRGVQASLELWLPPNRTGIQLLGFVDGGYAETVDGRFDSLALSSVGIGARWSWRRHLAVALDYGVITSTTGSQTIENGDDRLHFSVFLRN